MMCMCHIQYPHPSTRACSLVKLHAVRTWLLVANQALQRSSWVARSQSVPLTLTVGGLALAIFTLGSSRAHGTLLTLVTLLTLLTLLSLGTCTHSHSTQARIQSAKSRTCKELAAHTRVIHTNTRPNLGHES
jgi:hypothetical protein